MWCLKLSEDRGEMFPLRRTKRLSAKTGDEDMIKIIRNQFHRWEPEYRFIIKRISGEHIVADIERRYVQVPVDSLRSKELW